MRRITVISIFFICFLKSGFANTVEVIYPNRDGMGEKAFGYQLLVIALKKSGEDYRVKIEKEPTNQDRALFNLERGTISVVDTGVGKEFESKFDAVYIPIDRGLTGWRIFLINKSKKDEFAKIKTVSELQNRVAGQGIGWSDIKIIENAGIKVVTSPKIESLVTMVEKGRFDFLPLGVNEAYGFLSEFGRKNRDVIVEENIILKYQFARLFYVKKGNKKLHDDIAKGLENAFQDGTFQKFINSHPFFKEGIEKAKLSSRVVIKIENPFLTEKFKGIDSKWWYKIN